MILFGWCMTDQHGENCKAEFGPNGEFKGFACECECHKEKDESSPQG